MTEKELEKLNSILAQPRYLHSRLLEEWARTAEVTEDEIIKDAVFGTITPKQFKALHVYAELRAESLNDAGLTVQKVLAKAMDIEWTKYRFKELMWKKSLKQLYGKDSTRAHSKQEEIDNVHKHIERFLGQEWHLEYMPFPSDEKRTLENMALRISSTDIRDSEDYPEYIEPTL